MNQGMNSVKANAVVSKPQQTSATCFTCVQEASAQCSPSKYSWKAHRHTNAVLANMRTMNLQDTLSMMIWVPLVVNW